MKNRNIAWRRRRRRRAESGRQRGKRRISESIMKNPEIKAWQNIEMKKRSEENVGMANERKKM